jgi:hypothetical protein
VPDVNAVPFNIKPVVVEGDPFFVFNVIAPAPEVEVEASKITPPKPVDAVLLIVNPAVVVIKEEFCPAVLELTCNSKQLIEILGFVLA